MWSRFKNASSGAVGVVFSLSIVVLVVAAGAAVDYGQAVAYRTNLQKLTDQAAVAGMARGSSQDADREFAAERMVRGGSLQIRSLTTSASADSLLVEAQAEVPTSFMRLAGIDVVPVSASSMAELRDGLPCVLILEPSDNGLEINSDSRLEADCGVHVNSRNAEAIFANSDSHLRATRVCVVGAVHLNSGSTVAPDPETCEPRRDPLASLPEPVEANRVCDYTDMVVDATPSATLRPGVYCKKLEINSDAHVKLEPGVYVIRDGELKVNSRSSITGSGVMIFFQGKEGRLNVNSDSRVNLVAPSSGVYQGILLFQSRESITLESDYHIVNSDGNTVLQGAIYFPNGQLMLNSLSTTNAAADWTVLIARRLSLNSFGTFVAKAGYASETPVPAALAGLGREREVVLVR